MASRGPLRINIEATKAPGNRQVVYLHVNGYRFELEAPTDARAREIVLDLARALGLDQGDV